MYIAIKLGSFKQKYKVPLVSIDKRNDQQQNSVPKHLNYFEGIAMQGQCHISGLQSISNSGNIYVMHRSVAIPLDIIGEASKEVRDDVCLCVHVYASWVGLGCN